MMGLLFLLAFGIYLVVSISAIIIAANRAKRNGRNPWLWAFIAAFIMYNLVFWDLVPTKLLHKYYCATQAGFWVYKTPEQWKAENPGVAETLTWREISPKCDYPNVSRCRQLNERFVWVIKGKKPTIFPVGMGYEYIIDVKTDEVVVKKTSVFSGYKGAMGFYKAWVASEPCIPQLGAFGRYQTSFKQLGRKIK